MADSVQTTLYDFTPYQAAFIMLGLETDGALIDTIDDYCFASGPGCMCLNVAAVLQMLEEADLPRSIEQQALHQLCQAAIAAHFDDILVHVGESLSPQYRKSHTRPIHQKRGFHGKLTLSFFDIGAKQRRENPKDIVSASA